MDPEDLPEIITAFRKWVAETVRRFGGFASEVHGRRVPVYFGFPKHDAERAVRIGLEFAAEPRGRWLAPTGARYKVDGTARPGTPMTVFVERPTTLHAICVATTLSDPLADNMGKRRTPLVLEHRHTRAGGVAVAGCGVRRLRQPNAAVHCQCQPSACALGLAVNTQRR
jgi:class 3 adenylate cyclase